MLLSPFAWSSKRAETGQGRVALRRFAGPAAYVDRMRPVRVAHVTDLHVGRVTPFEIQREAQALVNAQEPDLIAITGDFVCHSQLYLDQLAQLMAGFRAPVVAVLGNHDYWAGAEEVCLALRRSGVEVLRNQHITLTVRGQAIQIVGLDDAYTGHARREKAVAGLRRDVPVLALSHIAEEADLLWSRGIPLVLSGHTHGGQITLARLHEITLGKIGGHKYVHGLYGSRRANDNGGAVYVGAGIGAAVMPLRIGDRGKREVTIFELGVPPGRFDEHHAEQRAMRGRAVSAWKLRRRMAKVARKRDQRANRRTAQMPVVP
ncbi:MAG: metallophosphoesterase [Deltaproteobacteria bacterium]|jgi:predicted MPP superfamily phosphohydrolase|nr:metallophosphoesterase [Deltaproteobacteria bacterium]